MNNTNYNLRALSTEVLTIALSTLTTAPDAASQRTASKIEAELARREA